jgi:hypothetical protein
MTKAGTSIPARVTVDNRTGHSVVIVGCPGIDYEIVAGNSKVPNTPGIPTVLCESKMSPGLHVFHTKVLTTYMGCGGEGFPLCGNPPKLLPLPDGTYHTQLILPGSPSMPKPRALAITLTGVSPRVSVTRCHAAQMTVSVHSVSMKPPNSSIAWYGQVTFKNNGAACEMDNSTVTVVAETGTVAAPRALSRENSPVALGGPIVVQNGDSVHTWLEVTQVRPKDWQPGYCPPIAVSELAVGGPSRAWPLKHFALEPVPSVCSILTIKTNSGLLEPGA